MPITIPQNILDFDSIIDQIATDDNCTHPAGHCFGSDGGTGIPNSLKVAKGRGGEFEIWQLNKQKTTILRKLRTERCQYCLKYYIFNEI